MSLEVPIGEAGKDLIMLWQAFGVEEFDQTLRVETDGQHEQHEQHEQQHQQQEHPPHQPSQPRAVAELGAQPQQPKPLPWPVVALPGPPVRFSALHLASVNDAPPYGIGLTCATLVLLSALLTQSTTISPGLPVSETWICSGGMHGATHGEDAATDARDATESTSRSIVSGRSLSAVLLAIRARGTQGCTVV